MFRIAHRLAVAIAIPTLLLLGFAAYNLHLKWRSRTEMVDLQTRISSIADASHLVHELQRERGASAVFLGSKGEQMRGELGGLRARTDQVRHSALTAMRSLAATGSLDGALAEAEAAIAALDSRRREIDALAITAAVSSAYFTDTIAKMLVVADEIAKSSGAGGTASAVAAYISFVQGKERAGQERAVGAAGVSGGKFDLAGYTRMSNLVAGQELLFALFEKNATPEQRQFYKTALSAPAAGTVAKYRQIISAGGLGGEMSGLDGKSWFDATTARIDLLKTVEDRLSRDLLALSASQYASADRGLWVMGVLVALGLAGSMSVVALVGRGITSPLNGLRDRMTQLANGDYTIAVEGTSRRDEIGAMAGAVQVFKEKMIRAHELEDEAAEVKAKAEADRKRGMRDMADHFEQVVGSVVISISDAAKELQSTAQGLSSSASQTSHQSMTVAAASEQAATNVHTVAAAAEQLAGSVREISRQVSMSAGIAQNAAQEAAQTKEQVSGLSAAAQKIGAIVDLINDIASKTNLLALNATIEAARAGEAGRGFAVVAQEVKGLAEQTGKATAEITSQITAVQASTDLTATTILGIGKIIDEINSIAGAIASAVEQQGAATDEIAANIDQAASGTTEVTRNITAINQAAGDSSASAEQVLASANQLASQSDKLRGEMQQFLTAVRAA